VTEQSRGEIIDQSEFTAQWIEKHLDRLLKNCEMASPAGNASDLHASEKIVALMEEALKVKAK
jgi:UDP-N-acetylglucosamine--N-acetylmuramyl-(pentapeptide) pyrophosphoryl-undecaprenol N-acetylglucosamine transferase